MSGNILKKKGLLPAAAIGLSAALGMTALLCLGIAALIHNGTLPMAAAGLCAVASAGVSIWCAVLMVSRLRGRQAMPTAGIIAGGFVFLAALICALGGEKSTFGPWLWQLGLAALAGGILGAVMSLRQNSHKKARMSRR